MPRHLPDAADPREATVWGLAGSVAAWLVACLAVGSSEGLRQGSHAIFLWLGLEPRENAVACLSLFAAATAAVGFGVGWVTGRFVRTHPLAAGCASFRLRGRARIVRQAARASDPERPDLTVPDVAALPSAPRGPGGRSAHGHSPVVMPHRGFTLIELILVMALLVVVLSVGFPSLASFFRGRALDSEARRFLSLTRYAQSRAVAEGVPMLLWVNPDQARYGLQAAPGYLEPDEDAHAMEFTLANELRVEVSDPPPATNLVEIGASLPDTLLNGRTRTGDALSALPTLRFLPDGYVGEPSPERILLWQGETDAIAIVQARTRLNYAIETNQNLALGR